MKTVRISKVYLVLIVGVLVVCAVGGIAYGFMKPPVVTACPKLAPVIVNIPQQVDVNAKAIPQKNPDYMTPNPQQMGILSTLNDKTGEPIVLPLYGKRLKSDRWNYYAGADKDNLWRIPINNKGRDCTDRYNGCEEIYDGDTVSVPTYQRDFAATIYPYELPK